jgi:hypothetical protein
MIRPARALLASSTAVLLGGLAFFDGCTENVELVITSKKLVQETAKVAGLPKELSPLGSSVAGYNFWVEGTIENLTLEDISNVVVIFEADDGLSILTLIGEVPVIPSGETIQFRTRPLTSLYPIVLLEDRTEILH